jgi:hypothetical protein
MSALHSAHANHDVRRVAGVIELRHSESLSS